MAPEQTIRLIRAQDLTIVATMEKPRSISGWAITFQVRDSLGGTSRITKTVGGGITITDGGKGVISISLAKADTSSLTVRSYVWDIKRTDSGSNVVLARGELILEETVTS
jgi:hypothetical protein